MPVDVEALEARVNVLEFLVNQLGAALTTDGPIYLLNGQVRLNDPNYLEQIFATWGEYAARAVPPRPPPCPALCIATDENVTEFVEARLAGGRSSAQE